MQAVSGGGGVPAATSCIRGGGASVQTNLTELDTLLADLNSAQYMENNRYLYRFNYLALYRICINLVLLEYTCVV